MLVMSHYIKIDTNFEFVCSVAGEDNAYRFIFGWSNLKTENMSFCKECS